MTSAAIVAALGVAEGPAYGAVFAGTFDPVDFSGSFTLVIDDACLLTDGWKANSGACTGTLTFANASVNSSTPDGPNFNGSLTFAPPSISSNPPIFGFYILNGTLNSFDSGLIHHVGSTPATPDDWWLQFVSGQMPGGNHAPPTPACDPYCFDLPSFTSLVTLEDLGTIQQSPLDRGVYLYAGNGATQGQPLLIDMAQYTSIRLLPEPGSFSLVLGALAAGWLARRRSRDTPS